MERRRGDHFPRHGRRHPLYAAFVLVIALHLRRGEVLGIACEDVDVGNGTVRVRQQLQRIAGELQLTAVKTRRSSHLRLQCERRGVRRMRLHDTRHTWASLLAAAGTTRAIAAILGHRQIGVTMNIHTPVATEDQRAAVGLLGGLL